MLISCDHFLVFIYLLGILHLSRQGYINFSNNGIKINIKSGFKAWKIYKLIMIEWLVINANLKKFQLYHGENKLYCNFNEMMMRSVNYETNMLSWIFFMVLAHWNNSPRIDMSPHSNTLFWFRVYQSLIFLLNAVCLAEKLQIPIL